MDIQTWYSKDDCKKMSLKGFYNIGNDEDLYLYFNIEKYLFLFIL